jgi:hypothetical protein
MSTEWIGKVATLIASLRLSILFIVIGLILVTGSHKVVYHMFVPEQLTSVMKELTTDQNMSLKPLTKKGKAPVEAKSTFTLIWEFIKTLLNYIDTMIGVVSGATGLYNLTKKFRKKKIVEELSD